MKFRFRLETLLKYRSHQEDVAKKEYAEAQAQVNQSLQKIEKMWAEIEGARRELIERQHKGGRHGEQLSEFDKFIQGQHIRIQREKDRLRQLMMAAEQAREILIERSRSKQVIMKLKDRNLERHRDQLRKRDKKLIDEIVTTRHKRGVS